MTPTQSNWIATAKLGQEWHGLSDPRLRVMAHAIRHEQQGEIALTDGERVYLALDIGPLSIRPDGQTISTTLCGRHLLCLPVGDMSPPNGAP
ncbi:hypothetical protein [Bradyrhizobium sp. SZCCHNS1054]|uniref:hypothetical protein n=1 Tax=Bradyrhizobium sp. SZCCHNS1054 TaxID=3057301 RepID=UPI00291612E5|nr:hypothetical protein [Bradyrhizobium sp. SZCCHNS1054]